MSEGLMSILEHIGEFRKRLIWILLVLAVALVGGFFAAKPVLVYLKNAEPAVHITWNAFTPWDGIRIYMQFSLIISLLVTLPVILFHIRSFAKPGLKEQEQKAILGYIPATVALFLTGISFAYFVVFPLAFKFASSFNSGMDLTETYGLNQYFSFMLQILVPISLIFELPIIIMFLTRLRLLNPTRLRKARRYAYMLQLLLSTLITPPDVISVLIVTIPLILLYEAGIMLSGYVYRKQVILANQF